MRTLMKKNKLIEIVNKCINEKDVRSDFDVVLPIISVNELNPNDICVYFKSISKNITFFRKELNYPLQLSNLLLYELDARNIKSNKGRGSIYRCDLIEKYKNIIQ